MTTWHLTNADPELKTILDQDSWRDHAEPVKHQKKRRTVYRVTLPESRTVVYIKHDHPETLRNQVKFLWRCKCKTEFDTAVELQRRHVPTVPPLGWGENGTESFLITGTIPGTGHFDDAWSASRRSPENRRRFIDRLAGFIRALVDAGIDHRDFHPGNFLVRTGDHDDFFFLVDFSNIVFVDDLSNPKRYQLITWLYDIFNELNRREQLVIMEAAGVCRSINEIDEVKFNLLMAPIKDSYRRWSSRRKRLLSDGKECESRRTDAGEWILKRPFPIELGEHIIAIHREQRMQQSGGHTSPSPDPSRLVVDDTEYLVVDIPENSKGFSQVVDDHLWMKLWRLRWHTIPVPAPYAWLHNPGTGDCVIMGNPGEDSLRTFLSKCTANDRRFILQALASLLARLHNYRIVIGNLDLDGIWVSRDYRQNDVKPLILTDIQDVTFAVKQSRGKAGKALKDILNLLPENVSRFERYRMLCLYARATSLKKDELRRLMNN